MPTPIKVEVVMAIQEEDNLIKMRVLEVTEAMEEDSRKIPIEDKAASRSSQVRDTHFHDKNKSLGPLNNIFNHIFWF